MSHLRDFSLVKLYRGMVNLKMWQQLVNIVVEEELETLQEMEDDIVNCIEHEVREEFEYPESYLLHWIARCPNHDKGRIMFQIVKRACGNNSQYHWHEIMRIAGYSMMVGAVMSQNIKLLEHAMAHVDEIELERILEDVDLPEIRKWYDENFVVT